MTCKFVLECNIREKWLADNNEFIKAVSEIFSVKMVFVNGKSIPVMLHLEKGDQLNNQRQL